ncbi:MAG: hypothetical protein MUO61_03475 [Dehalococcoidia bacterium]|nr:hypothetical protein [Dehalococcoidia bacterium]
MTTFTDTMADIQIEVNDREIYTDIRSETNETEGFEEAYSIKSWGCWFDAIPPGTTVEVTFYAESGDTNVTWLEIGELSAHGVSIPHSYISESECVTLGGTWRLPYGGSSGAYCGSPQMANKITLEKISETDTSITFEITNEDITWPTGVSGVFYIKYQYLAEKTITVRATDDTCEKKYGRRTMKLVWPLGQSIEQMQSFVDAYLARHKEPVPLTVVRIQGSTDALVEQILTRKISDRITINHTLLAMSADFFINAISPLEHPLGGTLEAIWQLEQVRPGEELTLFIIGTSLIGGPDVIAS